MAEIIVSPAQLRQVSGQFRQESQNSRDLIQRLDTSLNSMQAEFQGMTSRSFYSNFQASKTNMNQFVQLLEQVAQEMDAIAQRFEAADQAGVTRA